MISTSLNYADFTGSGSAGPFTFPFVFSTNSDITVTRNATPQTEGAGYSLTGAGNSSGGSVTLTSVLAIGETLNIRRTVSYTQPVQFANQGAFYPETHERAFDRVVMMVQQLDSERIDGDAGLAGRLHELGNGVIANPWVDDRAYDTLAEADAAAVAIGKDLVISNVWNTVPATLNADIRVIKGGALNNSTAVTATGRVVFDGGTFTGSGALSGNISVKGLYHVFIGAGAVKLFSGEDVYPQWFGARLNGTDDDAAAVNLAIESTQGATSPTYHRPVIRLSSGEWTFDTSINLVNKGAGTSLVGAGKYLTYIKGRTSTKPVIDCGGTTSVRVTGMAINSYPSQNPSAIGIQQLSQMTGATEGLQGTFDDIYIWLLDDITANGGIGTIGYLNCGGEETKFTNSRILANAPMVLTQSRTLTNVIADSTTFAANTDFATLTGNPPSEGVFALDHVALQSLGKRRSSLILYGANNVTGTLYLWGGLQPVDTDHPTAPAIGTHPYAIQMIGGNSNHSLRGNIERWGAVATFGGYIENTQGICAQVNLDFLKAIPDTADIDTPLFDLVTKNDAWTNKECTFQNCKWTVALTGNDGTPFYQRNLPFKDGTFYARPLSNFGNSLTISSYPSKVSGDPLAYEPTNALYNNYRIYDANIFALAMNEQSVPKVGSLRGQMFMNVGPVATGTGSVGVTNKELFRFLKSGAPTATQIVGNVTVKGLLYAGGASSTALTSALYTITFTYQRDTNGTYTLSAVTVVKGTEVINAAGVSVIGLNATISNEANYLTLKVSTFATVVGGPFPLIFRVDSVDTDGYGEIMEPKLMNGIAPL